MHEIKNILLSNYSNKINGMYSRPKYLGIRYEVGHDVEIIVEKYKIPKLHGPKKVNLSFRWENALFIHRFPHFPFLFPLQKW